MKPEVLERLRADVWPEFKGALERVASRRDAARSAGGRYRVLLPSDAPGPDIESDENATVWVKQARAVDLESVRLLVEALSRWCEEYQLTAEWLRDAALRTMLAWTTAPEGPADGWMVRRRVWRGALSEDELVFRFEAAWEPTTATRAAASQEIRERFDEKLREYLDERERLATMRGFVAAPRPRKDENHLQWLVRYQVGGDSYVQIARLEGLDATGRGGGKTVELGVKEAAKRLDFGPLRQPDRGGRPAKKA